MAKWVRNAIHTHQVCSSNMNTDPNLVMFYVPPNFTTLRYNKMKAYEYHFQVDNYENNLLVTFDYGVAFVFNNFKGVKMMFLEISNMLGP